MIRLLAHILYFYLSLVALFPAALWEECAKLPELYHHYQLHAQQEPDHSFLDFLAEHYGDRDDHHAASQDDHAKIPFKNPHTGASSVWSPVYLPGSVFSTDFAFSSYSLVIKEQFHYALAAVLEPLLPFWQPPKL